MSKVTVVDNMKSFVRENTNACDRSLNRMAIDIERLSKEQVPLLHGQLRSSGHHTRVGILKYTVSYNKEYAAFQEFGGDGNRTIRRYTKPGTKSHYLRDPGDIIKDQAINYIKQEIGIISI